MIKKSKIAILLAGFILFVFSNPALCVDKPGLLADIFEELGISVKELGDFTIQKNILREGLQNTFWTIVAKENGRVLKIEVTRNMESEYAVKHIKERQSIIEGLYKEMPSPYPGMISKAIECPDNLKPEIVYLKIEQQNIPAYILYSTPRFTYGASAEDLIKYRGGLVFIYNENTKTLYQIELFIPRKDFKKAEVLNIFRSIRFLRQPQIRQEKQPVNIRKEKSALKEDTQGKDSFRDHNLIIIGFDPLGAKHIGSYGYFRNTAPNLHKFSKKAFLFKNAVSPSSWTLPVFMSWFTSLYPSQHKIVNKYVVSKDEEQVISNLSELSPSVITLAEVLKKNNYSTAGFTGDAGVSGMFGYNLGFDVYYDETTFGGFDIVLPLALDWITKHKDKKFFVFIQGYDVHGRYQHLKNFQSKFVDSNYQGKYKGTCEEYWKLRNLSLEKESLDMNDEDVRFWRDWYDGKVYEADKRLGEFLEELDALGMSKKTIIVISSASGNEFYEHKRFDHGHSLYDELVLVPLIIKIPGKKNKVIKNQVRTIDIMPTVLELLDIDDEEASKQMQGVSLVSLIKGENLELDAFSETDYLLNFFKRSIRTNDGWKFIRSLDTGERELYKLKDDPGELNNLLEKEKGITCELEEKLFNWLKSMK